MSRLAILASLACLAACREVRIAPSSRDGSGGVRDEQQASGSASDGSSGVVSTTSSGAGGDGGGGGGLAQGGTGGADPVAQCAALAWLEDPVRVDTGPYATPGLVALEGGDVGLVALDVRDLVDVVTTRVLRDPWTVWPPESSAPIVFVTGEPLPDIPRVELDARSDGTFALQVFGRTVVGRFEDETILLEPGGYAMRLVPAAAGGAYLQLPDDPTNEDASLVGWLASLDGSAEPVRIACEAKSCGIPTLARLDGTALAVQGHTDPRPFTNVLRISPTGTEVLATHAGRWESMARWVPRRSGGAWVPLRDPEALRMLPLDASGNVDGSSWESTAPDGDGVRHLAVAPWRDGFVVLESVDPDAPGLQLTAWDGNHETRLDASPDEGPFERSLSVVASPDARTFLVAYEDFEHLVLRRARCIDD